MPLLHYRVVPENIFSKFSDTRPANFDIDMLFSQMNTEICFPLIISPHQSKKDKKLELVRVNF